MDLPTLGKPTRPTSASSFSSSWTSSSSPGVPGLANRGTCRVGVAKWVLPQPPLPPLATTRGSSPDMSASSRPVSASLIRVPRGTRDHQVRRRFCQSSGCPGRSRPALGGILALVAEIRQGGQVVVHLEHHVCRPGRRRPRRARRRPRISPGGRRRRRPPRPRL